MVECGNIDTPPSRSNMTIWGIVEFIIMIFIGVSCALNVINALGYSMSFWGIIWFVGNGFGVAGLVFVILGLFFTGGYHFKIGMICFFISILIAIVYIVITILRVEGREFYFSTAVYLCLDIFMAYVLWRQSGHLSA